AWLPRRACAGRGAGPSLGRLGGRRRIGRRGGRRIGGRRHAVGIVLRARRRRRIGIGGRRHRRIGHGRIRRGGVGRDGGVGGRHRTGAGRIHGGLFLAAVAGRTGQDQYSAKQ